MPPKEGLGCEHVSSKGREKTFAGPEEKVAHPRTDVGAVSLIAGHTDWRDRGVNWLGVKRGRKLW